MYCFVECRGPNYGYGCNSSCQCVRGTCNRNATNENESCSCDPGYQPPLCVQLIDACGKSLSFLLLLMTSGEYRLCMYVCLCFQQRIVHVTI